MDFGPASLAEDPGFDFDSASLAEYPVSDFDAESPLLRDEFGCPLPADPQPPAPPSPEQESTLREKRRLDRLMRWVATSKAGPQYLARAGKDTHREFQQALCAGDLEGARRALLRLSEATPAGTAPPLTPAEVNLDTRTVRYGFEATEGFSYYNFTSTFAELSEPDLRALGRPAYRQYVRSSFRGSYLIRVEDLGDHGTVTLKIASWSKHYSPIRHITVRITAAEVAAAAACFATVGPAATEDSNILISDGTRVVMEAMTPAGYRAAKYSVGDDGNACDRLLLRLTTADFDPFT